MRLSRRPSRLALIDFALAGGKRADWASASARYRRRGRSGARRGRSSSDPPRGCENVADQKARPAVGRGVARQFLDQRDHGRVAPAPVARRPHHFPGRPVHRNGDGRRQSSPWNRSRRIAPPPPAGSFLTPNRSFARCSAVIAPRRQPRPAQRSPAPPSGTAFCRARIRIENRHEPPLQQAASASESYHARRRVSIHACFIGLRASPSRQLPSAHIRSNAWR